MQAFPSPQGLYDAQHEHDACGVAFVATLTGEPSHDIVAKALTALRNLEHRGAAGAEPNSGDGAGILMQVPDRFLREVAAEAGFAACETAVMTHGGMGYAKEFHVERYLREIMIARIAPVSRELILSHIAERALGLPKSY